MNIRTMSLSAVLIIAGLLFSALLTASAAAQTDSPPNILFAIADDWSYGHASAYGSKWVETPGFDRVAKEGILFTNCYTPNAKCAPSRACLLTGRNSWQLEEAANHICFYPPKFKSYPEALGENGYFVGYTGKGWGPGVAKDTAGQTRQMTGRAFNQKQSQPPARSMSRNDYAGNFKEFLAAAPADQPWCFWYGASEPHRGYQKGVGLARGKKLTDIEHVPGFWPDNETIRGDMLDYAVEVEHVDNHLVKMLEELTQRGMLDNTLVVVTSDHGMPFPRCKGQAYDYSNHVPLAIMWKNGLKNPGRVVDDYVSFVDLAPTFIEIAGLNWNQTGMQPTPGISLTDIIASEKSGQVNPKRDHVLIGKERHDIGRPNDVGYPIRGIVSGGMLYIKNYETDRWPGGDPQTGYLNCDGSPTKTEILRSRKNPETRRLWELCFGKRPAEELYNLKDDPDCVHNLVGSPISREVKRRLELRMQAALKAQNDPRMFGNGDVFDKYVYSNAGTRNFYNRYMNGENIRAGWVNPTDFEKDFDE